MPGKPSRRARPKRARPKDKAETRASTAGDAPADQQHLVHAGHLGQPFAPLQRLLEPEPQRHEHVADDEGALHELARVAAPGATLLLSVPLHADAWTAFDEFVGHCRRYEPEAIEAKLAAHGFALERSAIYGMQPKSSRLLDLGQWFLTHRRERAMWWYNHVFMPLGLRFQKPLQWREGLPEEGGVDEVLLVCRRAGD